MQSSNLQSIEQKVFRVSVDHGWWDIYLGLLLICIAVSAALDDLGKGEYDLWLLAAALILFVVGHRLIIEPRLGRVRYGTRRKANLRIISLIIAVAVLLGVALWLFFSLDLALPFGQALPILLFIVLSVGGFGVAAHLLNLPRLYLYGLLYALSFATLELILTDVLRVLPTLCAGLIILSIGLVYFVNFLRYTPRPNIPTEDANDR